MAEDLSFVLHEGLSEYPIWKVQWLYIFAKVELIFHTSMEKQVNSNSNSSITYVIPGLIPLYAP